MSISWLHYQSCLHPLSCTNNMPVSLSNCHFLSIMCGKRLYGISHTITFSFSNYYIQLMTPSKRSQSHFHFSLPNPYQNSSLPCLKPPSHYSAFYSIDTAFHNIHHSQTTTLYVPISSLFSKNYAAKLSRYCIRLLLWIYMVPRQWCLVCN